MKLRPIGERAPVEPVEQEEKTASGIVLPEIATGDLVGKSVNEGDPVVFARYSGTGITLDNENYLILDADDLLGIVEE